MNSAFTSLPGGAEEHEIWKDPAILAQYGPNGDAGQNPLLAAINMNSQRCNPTLLASNGNSGPFVEGSGVSTGEFIEPVQGPITSNYGYRTHPVTGQQGSWHSGIDYGVPTGTPIKAADSGLIVDVEENCPSCTNGYGKIVRIRHSNGLETVYAHLSLTYPQIGDNVEQGQVIGLAGETGLGTGPHLHFEIRQGSGWGKRTNELNPLNYLRK